ncbi:MAG: class I SAM-dependent methyltransferase [Candidatus Omnitrophica bacterium]|nr:class I SAM-dependent methyltransferase [Candidatus Omnitrophota bacterium]
MAITFSGPRHFFRFTLITRLLKKEPHIKTILDAGSGDGSMSVILAGKGFRVHAVDNSFMRCEFLKSRLVAAHCEDKVNIRCSSLHDAVLEPGFFDAIVCGEVLEHIDDDTGILRKFHDALKENGFLILSVPLEGKGRDEWDDFSGHLRLYNFQELKQKLCGAGFLIERVYSWGYPFAKIFHRFVFLKWAHKFKNEEEIINSKDIVTSAGKSRFISVLIGLLFFVDLAFTNPDRGIGVIIKARKA